jgi:putative DNA primase/helicase
METNVTNVTHQYGAADDTVLEYVRLLKQSKANLTDLTNARRLVKIFGEDIRWNYLCKKWLVWNGSIWKSDDSRALIHQFGIKTIQTFYDDMLVVDDYQRRIELQKHAEKSESFTRQKCMIEFAEKMPEILIESDTLNTDPWLFNVKNGTINLKTRELLEHKKEKLITKLSPVEYDAAADCPTWKKFVREIMNYNAELMQFLQTVAGYSISGDTSEQKMFILFGSGANGKSTFLNTIAYILGDYAMTAQTETFMKQQGDKLSNDLARLRGARFVTAAEADQGRRLSETLIKQITGNDKMTPRFLFAEYFDFKPKLKLFLATNHKPVIKGTDNGIWRRIRLIPFTTTISEDNECPADTWINILRKSCAVKRQEF